MVTLDDKFAHFSQSVLGKARQNYEDQISDIEQKNQLKLEQFRLEIEEKAGELKAKTARQAQYEKKMKISKAQMSRKRRIMMTKDELMERLMHRVRLELAAYVGTEAYQRYLTMTLREYGPDLRQMTGIVLKMQDRDRAQNGAAMEAEIAEVAPGLKGKIRYESLPDTYIGGIILLNEQQTVRFDLTLDALLEERRGVIGELLHETFDKAGMNDE